MKVISGDGSKINIYLIGSPKYRVELTSNNDKEAEDAMDKVTKKIISLIGKNKGQAKFTRTK